MNILDRYKKPTPKLFRILRNLGVCLATAGGAILTAPVCVPDWLSVMATYIIVAGTVATAISQAAVEDVTLREDMEHSKKKENGR